MSFHFVCHVYAQLWQILNPITVQYVPEWFPGAGFKTTARKWNAEILEMVNQPHQWVKEKMVCYYMTRLDGWFVEIR